MARSQFFDGWIIKEEQKYWGWTIQIIQQLEKRWGIFNHIQPLFNNNNQYWGIRSSALARKRLNVKYPENQQVRTGSKIEYSDVHIEIVNIPLHSRSLTHPQIAIFPKQSDIFQCLPPYQCPKSKDQLSKSQKIYPNVSSPKIIPQNTWLRTVHPLNSENPKNPK